MLRVLVLVMACLLVSATQLAAQSQICVDDDENLQGAIYQLERVKPGEDPVPVGVATYIDRRGFFLTAKHIFDRLEGAELTAVNGAGEKFQLDEEPVVAGSYAQQRPLGADWAIARVKHVAPRPPFGDLTSRIPTSLNGMDVLTSRDVSRRPTVTSKSHENNRYPKVCDPKNSWYIWLDGYKKGMSGAPVVEKSCIHGITSGFQEPPSEIDKGLTDRLRKMVEQITQSRANNGGAKQGRGEDSLSVSEALAKAINDQKIIRVIPSICIVSELLGQWEKLYEKNGAMTFSGDRQSLAFQIAEQLGDMVRNGATIQQSLLGISNKTVWSSMELIAVWIKYRASVCNYSPQPRDMYDMCWDVHSKLAKLYENGNLMLLATKARPPELLEEAKVDDLDALLKFIEDLARQRGRRVELFDIAWFKSYRSGSIKKEEVEGALRELDELFDHAKEIRAIDSDDVRRALARAAVKLIKSLADVSTAVAGDSNRNSAISERLTALGFIIQAMRRDGLFAEKTDWYLSVEHVSQVERLLAYTAALFNPEDHQPYHLAARTFDERSSGAAWYLMSIGLSSYCSAVAESRKNCDEAWLNADPFGKYASAAIESLHRATGHLGQYSTLLRDEAVVWNPIDAFPEVLKVLDGAVASAYVKPCKLCSYVPHRGSSGLRQDIRFEANQLSFPYMWARARLGSARFEERQSSHPKRQRQGPEGSKSTARFQLPEVAY